MPIDHRNIVLVGMPGVGKSTMGVMLAKQAGYNFVDTDITIQVLNNATLEEIIAEHGNDYLLQSEEQVLMRVLASRCVVATGGSACYSAPAMRSLAATGPVVYLKVSLERLQERVGDLTKRGVVVPDGFTLQDLYEQRCALYEQWADITIDVTEHGPDEAVALIEKAVQAYLNPQSAQ